MLVLRIRGCSRFLLRRASATPRILKRSANDSHHPIRVCKSRGMFPSSNRRRQDKRLSRRNGLNRRQLFLLSRAVGSQGFNSESNELGNMTQHNSGIAKYLLPVSLGPYSHAEYLASVGRLRDTLKAIPVGSFIRNVFKAGAGQAPHVPPRFTITGIL